MQGTSEPLQGWRSGEEVEGCTLSASCRVEMETGICSVHTGHHGHAARSWSRFSQFGTRADTRPAAVIGRPRTGERRPWAAIGCRGHHATGWGTENKPSRGWEAEAEPERGLPISF